MTRKGELGKPEMALPHFVNDLLGSCPRTGEGVHSWLFRVSRQLHHHYSDKGEMEQLIAAACYGCGRIVPASEIQDAIAASECVAWMPSGKVEAAQKRKPKWPKPDHARISALTIKADAPGLAELWERSPVRFDDYDDDAITEMLVDSLFPGNPLLCCGLTDSSFATRDREEWRGALSDLQLIVPSPMSARMGPRKKDGELSAHTLANTGARRFLVIECDQGTADEQAVVIAYLAKMAPLALVLHSGGKSLHAWFYCAGEDETELLEFMRFACRLGADDATWLRSQFVRMPHGLRRNVTGKVRQSVFYFDPEVLR